MLKILYHIPYPDDSDASRWIYEGWRDSFRLLGHEIYEFTAYDNIENKIQEIKPDIFWTAYNIFDLAKNKEKLKWIRKQRTKVFMRMDWPRKSDEINIIRNEEIADVYFDEREPESMIDFEKQTGRKYFPIANGANKILHFPTNPVKKYQYDIVFLGRKLPMKTWFFDDILLPLTKKYNVGIFGPCWTLRDNVLRVAGRFFKELKLKKIETLVNKKRIVIPSEEENQLYSSAKISLNSHERDSDGGQSHYILNQRTFKIPACGGFEICDYVPALRKYFNEDEVIMAKDKQDWFEKIEYYLKHEEERMKIKEKGTKRALRDHTYNNRVENILNIYNDILIKERMNK